MALRHAGCGSTISQPCIFAPLVILSTIFLSTLKALLTVLASSCTVLTGLADNPGTGAGDSDLGDECPLSCKTTVIAVSCQKTGRKDGGARRDRTDDLLLAKQALSQLSYGPIMFAGRTVEGDAWQGKTGREGRYAPCYLRMDVPGQPFFWLRSRENGQQ